MPPERITEETIAAARLRLVLDEKLGRTTPNRVRVIAAMPGPLPVEPTPGDPDDPPDAPSALLASLRSMPWWAETAQTRMAGQRGPVDEPRVPWLRGDELVAVADERLVAMAMRVVVISFEEARWEALESLGIALRQILGPDDLLGELEDTFVVLVAPDDQEAVERVRRVVYGGRDVLPAQWAISSIGIEVVEATQHERFDEVMTRVATQRRS